VTARSPSRATADAVRQFAFVEFAYDYNQLYLYDAALDRSGADNAYLDALDAATQSGLTVGAASGVVDVLMPRQENFSAIIDVAITDSSPLPRRPPTTLLSSTSPRPVGSRSRGLAARGNSKLTYPLAATVPA
jgi:hypothetical protein